MRRYIPFLVAMLLTGAAVAIACGGGDTKTVNVPGGQVSVSNKLPGNFPSDFPVYGGAKVTGSYTGQSQGIGGTVVLWETGDGVDKVKSFYDDRFAKDPWKATSSGDISGSAYWAGESKDGTKAFYAGATNADGKTTITVTVGDKEKGSSSGSTKTSTASDSSDSGSSSSSSPTSNAKVPPEVKLAKDFPADRVPFPSGARVTSSSTFGSGGSKSYSVEIYVKDTPEKVGDYFSEELPKHGWTSGFSSESNGEYVETFTKEGANSTATESVTVSAAASDVSGYTTANIIINITGG